MKLGCEWDGHEWYREKVGIYGCKNCMKGCKHQIAIHKDLKDRILYCTNCGHIRFYDWDVKLER